MGNVCETKYSKYKYRKKVTIIRPICKVIVTVTCTFAIRSCIQKRHDSARNLHLGDKKFETLTRTARLQTTYKWPVIASSEYDLQISKMFQLCVKQASCCASDLENMFICKCFLVSLLHMSLL